MAFLQHAGVRVGDTKTSPGDELNSRCGRVLVVFVCMALLGGFKRLVAPGHVLCVIIGAKSVNVLRIYCRSLLLSHPPPPSPPDHQVSFESS